MPTARRKINISDRRDGVVRARKKTHQRTLALDNPAGLIFSILEPFFGVVAIFLYLRFFSTIVDIDMTEDQKKIRF